VKTTTKILDRLSWYKLYTESFFGGLKNKEYYDEVKNFCLFIGSPRSGHTLVSAILDAHPMIVVDSTEKNLTQLVNKGFSREQIFYILQTGAYEFAKSGKSKTGYAYEIKDQWQGKFEDLRVIGVDYISSVLDFHENPALLNIIQERINCNIKFIHVVRNPFDTISTMTIRNLLGLSLKNRIDYYNQVCEAAYFLQNKLESSSLITVKHEDFLAEPGRLIGEICSFINIDTCNNYIESCNSIINPIPHKSRNKIDWSNEQITFIKSLIEKYDFLKDYQYND
jgi:hypothetical protein